MDKLRRFARGLTARFPNGNEPFRIATRLSEECGEVASEVLHFEGGVVKMQKHAPPSREALAGEIRQVLCVAMQLAQYYGVEDEVEASIDASIARLEAEGYLD